MIMIMIAIAIAIEFIIRTGGQTHEQATLSNYWRNKRKASERGVSTGTGRRPKVLNRWRKEFFI